MKKPYPVASKNSLPQLPDLKGSTFDNKNKSWEAGDVEMEDNISVDEESGPDSHGEDEVVKSGDTASRNAHHQTQGNREVRARPLHIKNHLLMAMRNGDI